MFELKFSGTAKWVVTLICAMLGLQMVASGVTVGYACCPPSGTLNVEADVGSIHFRGEIAEFYLLVSYRGEPTDAEISAALYFNGTLQADVTALVEHVTTGLYRVPYTIPTEASAGTYTLVANAHRCTLAGTTLKSFLLSATLTSWNAWMIDIQGDLAIIQTDLGEIKVSLDSLAATLVSIDDRIATIETDLGIVKADIDNIELKLTSIEGNLVTLTTIIGEINGTIISIAGDIANIKTDIGYIQTDVSDIKLTLKSINGTLVTIQTTIGEMHVTLDQVNATLHALNGTVANIQTTIGTIETSIEDIQLEITAIKGDVATMRTLLGEINGTIVSIEGDIATITTDLGEVQASLPQTLTVGMPITAIFAVIAAIASIISVALLLRKHKTSNWNTRNTPPPAPSETTSTYVHGTPRTYAEVSPRPGTKARDIIVQRSACMLWFTTVWRRSTPFP